MDLRVGILPLFLLQIAVIATFATLGTVPSDLLMGPVILTAGGLACAEIGRQLPYLRDVGAPAIQATFARSYPVHAHPLPKPVVDSVSEFTRQSNFLYLFIAAIIVGSILGIPRHWSALWSRCFSGSD